MFEGLFNSNHEGGKCNCTWIILILLFICFCGCGCGKNKNWKFCVNPCTLAPILALAFLCGGIHIDNGPC
ncbi:MAG: hypothetical protein PHX51_01855 [Clostridia bacterium]|nr:hypothetical protein [Clostridia bacterium]